MGERTLPEVASEDELRLHMASERPVAPPGMVWRALFWFLPNRALDVLDVFRFRIRIGPGLAVHGRATRYVSAYLGRYETIFVGLPGPRGGPSLRPWWGREEERGLLLMDVDATDDLPGEPVYSWSEFLAGFQFILLGIEVGVDPIEIVDFAGGWLFFDPRKDDL